MKFYPFMGIERIKFTASIRFTFIQLLLELKGVFAKNERGYRLTAQKKSLFIASNLASSPFQLEEFVNH